MEFGLQAQAKTGDVFAVDRILRIQAQRGRLIAGLDVPQRIAAGVGGLDEAGNPSRAAPITIMMTPAELEVAAGDDTPKPVVTAVAP